MQILDVMKATAAVLALALTTTTADAAEQDAESKALDSTATPWSFQLAYESMPNYHDDTLSNGQPRPAGTDNYWQLRIVARRGRTTTGSCASSPRSHSIHSRYCRGCRCGTTEMRKTNSIYRMRGELADGVER